MQIFFLLILSYLFWHVYRRTTTTMMVTTKNPNHYKPNQTRCSYRPFSNFFLSLSHCDYNLCGCVFFCLQKLSHIIFIVCYVCVPAPRQLLFFAIISNLIFLWLNSHSLRPFQNRRITPTTTKRSITMTTSMKMDSMRACCITFYSFAKLKYDSLALSLAHSLLLVSLFFIHRLVWLNASMLIKIQKF